MTTATTMSRARFVAAVERLGCSANIERYGREGADIEIVAPDGFHFRGMDVHALVTSSDLEPAGQLYADALRDLKGCLPLEACSRDEPGCREWHGWPAP